MQKIKNFRLSRVALLYASLLICGGIGYFREFEVFLVAAIAVASLIGSTVMHKFYEFFIRDQSSQGSASASPTLFIALAVLFLIGSAFSYYTSKAIGTSGFLLGMAAYCAQSLLLGWTGKAMSVPGK